MGQANWYKTLSDKMNFENLNLDRVGQYFKGSSWEQAYNSCNTPFAFLEAFACSMDRNNEEQLRLLTLAKARYTQFWRPYLTHLIQHQVLMTAFTYAEGNIKKDLLTSYYDELFKLYQESLFPMGTQITKEWYFTEEAKKHDALALCLRLASPISCIWDIPYDFDTIKILKETLPIEKWQITIDENGTTE